MRPPDELQTIFPPLLRRYCLAPSFQIAESAAEYTARCRSQLSGIGYQLGCKVWVARQGHREPVQIFHVTALSRFSV